jgi:hypothetical protein
MIRFRTIASLAIAVALTTGFTACGTFGQPSQAQQQGIAAACASIAASEDVLAVVNRAGKLSQAQYDAVMKAIAIKSPICNVSPMPTSIAAAAYQELLGASSTLSTAAAKAH